MRFSTAVRSVLARSNEVVPDRNSEDVSIAIQTCSSPTYSVNYLLSVQRKPSYFIDLLFIHYIL